MVNGVRTIYTRGLNKVFSLRFCVGFRVRHDTLEEGQRIFRPKRCEYSNEDEDNIVNILRDKKSKYNCKCRSLRFNRYSFLDWTLPPAPVASGWKVREELPAWTPAGANSIFFKLTGMRDWHFSLWVTSKAKIVFTLENVCLFLRWTCVQMKIYIFISTRLVSMIFGPSCCC